MESLEAAVPLGPDATHQYRVLAARTNYLSLDPPDIGFAAKVCCRKMAEPSTLDWAALVRLVRYLSGRRCLVYNFPLARPRCWAQRVRGYGHCRLCHHPEVNLGGAYSYAVSYTHLTLPTILRV